MGLYNRREKWFTWEIVSLTRALRDDYLFWRCAIRLWSSQDPGACVILIVIGKPVVCLCSRVAELFETTRQVRRRRPSSPRTKRTAGGPYDAGELPINWRVLTSVLIIRLRSTAAQLQHSWDNLWYRNLYLNPCIVIDHESGNFIQRFFFSADFNLRGLFLRMNDIRMICMTRIFSRHFATRLRLSEAKGYAVCN